MKPRIAFMVLLLAFTSAGCSPGDKSDSPQPPGQPEQPGNNGNENQGGEKDPK